MSQVANTRSGWLIVLSDCVLWGSHAATADKDQQCTLSSRDQSVVGRRSLVLGGWSL